MPLLQADVPAQATAATVQDFVIGEASHGGTVREVAIIPEAAVAADATNNRTFRVINKGQAGAGTTVVASHQTTTGGALVAFDEKLMTLSVVAGATTVVEGDVLVADEVVTGTGQAHGGYTIKVIYQA
jgi:hypothetical protein